MRLVWSLVLVLLVHASAWAQPLTLTIAEWNSNGYVQSQLVRYRGTIFFCTGGPAFPPGNICPPGIAPDNAPNGGVWNSLSGLNQWNSSVTYPPSAMTVQSGQLYSAIVANTNVDPAGGLHPETWSARSGPPAPLYNVRAFGALGLGSSCVEDTAAFLAAINAATSAPTFSPGTSRSVYVPAGVYCINSTLTIARNFLSFYGDGPSSILTSTTASPILQLNPEGGGGPFGMAVHDLHFAGALGTTGLVVNPVASNSGRSQYYNLTFEGFGTAISFLNKSDWNQFTGISIISGTNGMNFTGIGTGNIFSSLVLLSSGIGINIQRNGADSGIGDITFLGLQFGGNFATGMKFQAPPGIYSDRIGIVNAQFDASCGVGIDMPGYSNVIIAAVIGGCVTNNLVGTTGVINLMGNASGDKSTIRNISTTGAAGNKVVCVDTATGQLYASTTGTDCSN